MNRLDTLKLLHVLFIFIWIGSLLALTRLMGYHAKQTEETQRSLGKIYRRMYLLVDLPAMVLAIFLGVVLLVLKGINLKAGWFHMKMTFTVLLVICDIYAGRQAFYLSKHLVGGKGVKYKILHGLTALFLIGVLVSIYIFKARALAGK